MPTLVNRTVGLFVTIALLAITGCKKQIAADTPAVPVVQPAPAQLSESW
jgi:hypothetical protein